PYLSSLTLPEIALPHMRDLVAASQESVTLALLDGDGVVYVAHVSARRMMTVSVSVGERDPAMTTSLGRVLLAGKPDEGPAPVLASQHLEARTERTSAHPGQLPRQP